LGVGNRGGLVSGRDLIESVVRVDGGGLALGRGGAQVGAHVGNAAWWSVGLERLSVRFQVGVSRSDGPIVAAGIRAVLSASLPGFLGDEPAVGGAGQRPSDPLLDGEVLT
jgi:hypothetical protein